ncbi:and WD repeat domain-containing 2-like [Octopus vulgaris]|uniref:And WD repeat domain-containing 2-like n=1 Tax=Octopus vulgaris TaxID=6645 RepID=A0AA36BJ08_OCTVU|nr:and WD repeat domain-containing 2-like [Octopus vulgaris]
MTGVIRMSICGNCNGISEHIYCRKNEADVSFHETTNSDTQIERNSLMTNVYPKIREFCVSQGLDFQVIDMRWGIPEGTQLEFSTKDLCLSEIENCQHFSMGPNFVGFIGCRYGYRPLPYTIDEQHFDYILQEANAIDSDNIDLLDKWYIKDSNAVPPVYVLQPIRSVFRHFMSRDPNMAEQRAKDTQGWKECERSLLDLIRRASDAAYQNSRLTEEQKHDFFASESNDKERFLIVQELLIQTLTESEMIKGIFQAENPSAKTLVYLRKFIDFPESLDGDDIGGGVGQEGNMVDDSPTIYVDFVEINKKKQVDEEAKELLENCIARLESEKMVTSAFDVIWLPGGIDIGEYHEPHQEYISEFCETFKSDMINLIQQALDDQNRIAEDYYEILHHLHFCVQKCALFCGQQDTLEKIQQITKENNLRKPIVIHAPSGVGKTSLLAMIMKQLSSWFSDNYLAVIRFLGTTQETCNIYNVLLSVMKQLSSMTGMILEPMGYVDMNRLEKYFPRFLRQFGQSIKKPVFILLDSLDQLSEDDDAFSMAWLPDFLPTNVHVIVSTLPQAKIMKNLANRLQRDDCFIEVPLMSETIGEEVLRKFFNKKKRTITDSQKEQLLAKFSKVSSPLYLKLLLHEASQWLSYEDIDFEQLPDSVNSAIEQHFENLERKFGKTLVQFALGYLTISLNGLTELELIDALSCNNEVLNAIFEMNDPPSRKIINLPPFLWARIYHDIRDYLTGRFSHGKSTFYWYHRQFIEAASRRYTQNEENLHADLAEIFACESNIKKDLILQQRNWVIYDADRNITPQILNFENKRKLECITYHICRAGDFINTKDVKENAFCNIHFLFTKITVFSQDHIIREIKDFLTKRPDRDIQVILELLQDINEEIQSLEQLAFLILANLAKTNNGSSLTSLIEKSEQILYSSNRKMLIPTCNCLKNRNSDSITDSKLVFTFPNYSSIIENRDGIILLEKRASEMSPFAVILTNGCIELTRLNHGQIQSFIPTTDGDRVYLLATERIGSLNSSTLKIRWQNDDILKNYGTPYLCSWTKDGSYLVIAFDSNQIALFYVRENKLRMSTAFPVKEGLVFNNLCLFYNAEALSVFASSTNGELVEYSKLDNHNPSTKKKQLSSTISSLQMTNNDELIVLKLSGDQTLLCSLLTETFQETGKYKFDGESTDFELCSSSALLAVLKDKNKICILDAFNYLESQTIKVPCPTITCFAVKWSKHQVLASYMDTLIIFDYSNETILFQLESHSDPIKCLALSDNFAVTIDTNFILKLWDFSKVNSSDKTPCANRRLTEEQDVISFAINQKAATIVTGSQHNQINEWNSNGFLLKSFKINLRPQEMHLINDKYLLAYEKSKGKLEIYDFETTEIHLPFKDMYILAITTYQSFEEILLYTVNDHKNYLTVAISDIGKKKFMMEIPCLKDFEFTSLEVSLTPLCSYILFKFGITDSDYKDIEQKWKTKGGFSPQPYPYRFAALKLDSGNGILKQCFRQLTDIPTLGRTASPLQGNQIMIVSGRAVLIWDIFTGKCDEAIAKSVYRKSKFRRYLDSEDENCEGLCFESSVNSKYVTIGYADGFVIIYRTSNGRPMIETLPETKHEASVSYVEVFKYEFSFSYHELPFIPNFCDKRKVM